MRATRFGVALALMAALVGGGATVAALRRSTTPDVPAATSAPTAPATPSAPSAPPRPASVPLVAPYAVGTSGPGAPVSPAGLRPVLDPALRAPALGPATAALVVDVTSGAPLYGRRPAASVVPASTAKLVTAAAALRVLGPDARLTTRVLGTGPPVTAGVLRGDLVVVGGGDPTLASSGAPVGYPVPARLDTLAAEVQAAGVRRVTGRLVVDTSLYSGPPTAPGWKPTYVTEGNVAPVTALMVDGGRRRPGRRTRSADPALAAGELFQTLLRRRGVVIAVPRVTRGRAPATGLPVAEVQSAPVGALVERMLSASDNDLAEALGRHVALRVGRPASFAGAAAALTGVLEQLGVRPGDVRLADASGLSVRNRVTPAALVRLLRASLTTRGALRRLLSGLPVGGFEGTLEKRYARPASRPGAGRVRAKTGSLDNVTSLAGVVQTASGRLLVFAFSADRVPTRDVTAAAEALDAAAAGLARCGCR